MNPNSGLSERVLANLQLIPESTMPDPFPPPTKTNAIGAWTDTLLFLVFVHFCNTVTSKKLRVTCPAIFHRMRVDVSERNNSKLPSDVKHFCCKQKWYQVLKIVNLVWPFRVGTHLFLKALIMHVECTVDGSNEFAQMFLFNQHKLCFPRSWVNRPNSHARINYA